ncbi:MAG: Ig-like domain-containing protein, partial [Candidatus Uhrbacteria bacterium]
MKYFSKILLLLIVGVFALGLIGIAPVHAQDVIDQTAFQAFAQEAGFGGTADIRVIIARLIRTALSFAGLVLVVYIMYGGFLWMTSGGQAEKITKARSTIINAIIGIVIVFSSWAITTFIIGSLVGAVTGGGIIGGGGEPPGGCPGCPPEYGNDFVVESYGCATGDINNMNVVVTVLFSQNVTSDSIAANLKIYQGGDEVEGSYSTGYRSVTFVPDAECVGYPGEYCFDAGADYDVQIGLGLESTGGDLIDCAQGAGCSSSFSILSGAGVDVDDPVVAMTDPEDGDYLPVGEITSMQASATDDGGVNQVTFYVDGSEEDNAVEMSPDLYSGTWDAPESGNNNLYARAYDCAGNMSQSATITVVGGDGQPCEADDECETGQCIDGFCAGYPQIEMVSPGDGAPGTYVSLIGDFFGETVGSVVFLGADGDGDDVTADFPCVASWSDSLVIVEVPSGAESGPIKLTTAEAYEERTDDDNGPLIADFEVNEIARPGLCEIDPASGLPGIAVNLSGASLGTEGTLYFSSAYGTFTPSVYNEWTDSSIEAVVPPMSAAVYTVEAWVGGYGSNELLFTVESELMGTTPVIDYIDSGLSQCSGNPDIYCVEDTQCRLECDLINSTCTGDPTNTACSSDDDCSFGSCETAENNATGPVGQYVTLFGSDFDDNPPGGLVYFTDAGGDDYLADTDFPASCSDGWWSDDSVTVKVPSGLSEGEFSVYLERSVDQAISNSVDFDVVDGVSGPSICAVDPDSGPVGTDVSLFGEGLGAVTGSVTFWTDIAATITSWDTDEIATSVPSAATSGPVQAFAGGLPSNPIEFTVADCNEEPDVCAQDAVCCDDGTCDDSEPYCEEEEVSSTYLWRFSTGQIPDAPEVLVQCSEDPHVISPTPYTRWDGGDEACVNSLIQASFESGVDIDTGSLVNADTVIVQQCLGPETDPCSGANLSDPLTGSISAFDNSFDWTLLPAGDRFSTETWYQVTLVGGEGGVESVDEVPMEDDFVWNFYTRADENDCEVDDVLVTPYTSTLISIGDSELYGSSAVCGGYQCQLCIDEFDWTWTEDYTGEPYTGKSADQIATFIDYADPDDNRHGAEALSETEGSYFVNVIAQIISEGVFDSGKLYVSFSAPSVEDWWPRCTEACVNSEIGLEFNVDMEDASFANNVTLYQCADSACNLSLQTVSINTPHVGPDVDGTMARLIIEPTSNLAPNSYFKVEITGDNPGTIGVVEGVTSTSGVGLSDEMFDWIFKTKSDATPCAVEAVEVAPERDILDFIGEQTLFAATPLGAPDECTPSGQRLVGSGYNWDWSIDQVLAADGFSLWDIAFFPFFIDTTADLPGGCSTNCLNTGSSINVSVCGNSVVETGEDCDDSGYQAGDMCDANCLREGFAAVANGGSCGDGVVDCVGVDLAGFQICEECDNGGTCGDLSTLCTSNAACSGVGGYCDDGTTRCYTNDECFEIGNETCDLSLEVCAPRGADGCSSVCTNEGSREGGTTCGDGIVVPTDPFDPAGGEDCDDGNIRNGDGCSSVCLNEGTENSNEVIAVCGNGGNPEPGEDCDDGNWDNNDGCSSSCLNEGSVLTCGDGNVDTGEDCDDGNTASGDGCSSSCLSEGSSYLYSSPSFCGDGEPFGTGEECEAGNVGGDGNVDAMQVVEIHEDAAAAVLDLQTSDPTIDLLETNVNAVESSSLEEGTGLVGIDCSCNTDLSCGTGTTDTIGCGTSGCCFERPTAQLYPTGNAVCRNSRIYAEFDQTMDRGSFSTTYNDAAASNLSLVLLGFDENADGEKDIDVDDRFNPCPEGYTNATLVTLGEDRPWYVRAWQWVARKVMSVFGQEVYAGTTEICYMNGQVSFNDFEAGTEASFIYTQPLEPQGYYGLFVAADPTLTDDNDLVTYNVGVTSSTGVSLAGDPAADNLPEYAANLLVTFTADTEICELDLVRVEDVDADSPGYMSVAGEEHDLQATALTVRGPLTEEITPITGFYNWTWAWASTRSDDVGNPENVIVADDSIDPTTLARTAAPAINGYEYAVATATITEDTILSPPSFHCSDTTAQTCAVDTDCPGTESCVGDAKSGSAKITAFLCENPWPAVGHFPFEDTFEGYDDFEDAKADGLAEGVWGPDARPDLVLNDPTFASYYSNFSFYYCRDAGDPNTTADDLPGLRVAEAPVPVSPNVFRELLFIVDGEGYSDAIGVRIASNEGYLAVDDWYDEQEFSGSVSFEELDGYEGGRDGNTLYVNAANATGQIYPNIYVVAYNDGAADETLEIHNQILDNWNFNANSIDGFDQEVVPAIELCYEDDVYGTLLEADVDGDGTVENVECSYDAECAAVQVEAVCGDYKAKLTRDTKRLSDLKKIISSVESYGSTNKHCSITSGQGCYSDDTCPGDETCVSEVPTLEVGTFLRSRSYSAWPSWQSQLGNALGLAVPTDPLNNLVDCPEGYDQDSCWSSDVNQFVCNEGSHIFGYRSVAGTAYELFVDLEFNYNGHAWAYDFDVAGDLGEITLGNSEPGLSGFALDPVCNGTPLGTSTECGDGIIGENEICEIGDSISSIDLAGLGYPVSATCNVCVNDSDGAYDGLACTAGDHASCGTGGIPGDDYFCADGVTSYACADVGNNTCDWDTSVSSACIPYQCGNGVIDPGETCDDGSMNGAYGYCGEDCTQEGGFFCGDAYLAGGEMCDCGYNDNYRQLAGSWAQINSCTYYNGLYSTDPDAGCAYDCGGPPAYCGDAIVNGAEQCDSEVETWTGKLCDDAERNACETDDDCDTGVTCGKTSGNLACDSSQICETGDEIGKPCTTDGDCLNGECSAITYDLFRQRTCEDDVSLATACTWNTWIDIDGEECIGSGACGNGVVEGTEECDDGNDSSNDSCTNSCELNVCGDAHQYIGVESCDFG